MKSYRNVILGMSICVLLLAGCQKKTEPVGEITPEPTRTVTVAPTVTPEITPEVTQEPTPEPLSPENVDDPDALPEGMVASYLTGEAVPQEIGRRRPVAVMLNNIINACPQTGIGRAGVIYEAPVEGGITRLMGIFEDYDDLTKIGSVRSCREYYTYLDTGFDAIYFHYGQAAYAIPLLESDNIDNVNGMDYSNEVYYRTTDRKSPHNAYLSADGIRRGIELCGYRTSYREDYEGSFHFASKKDPELLEDGTVARKITPGGYFHNKPWFQYDEATGAYLRYQFGEPQIDDRDNEQLSAKNIILQFCSWKKYEDNSNYLNIDVVSGGTGTYITNGKATDITWNKEDPWGVTRYYDGTGNEILLNPGKTWILIILDNYAGETIIE